MFIFKHFVIFQYPRQNNFRQYSKHMSGIIRDQNVNCHEKGCERIGNA